MRCCCWCVGVVVFVVACVCVCPCVGIVVVGCALVLLFLLLVVVAVVVVIVVVVVVVVDVDVGVVGVGVVGDTENDHNKTLVLSMRSLSRHGWARSAADRAVPCTYSVRIKFHAAKLKGFNGTPCKTSGPYLGGESIPTLSFS